MTNRNQGIEYLLFACHKGQYRSRTCGIIMGDHALPLAFSVNSIDSEEGIHALWEATSDIEEFFDCLNIDHTKSNGLWVAAIVNKKSKDLGDIQTANDEEDLDEDLDDAELDGWEHLVLKDIQEPSEEEIANLCKGLPPWEGGILL